MCLRFVIGFLLWLALPLYAAETPSSLLEPPTLKLVLDGKTAYRLDQAALAAMPRATARAAAKGEPPSMWQGVALQDIVDRICVVSGDALSGRALARFVRVTGADGYQVVFSAAELHPDFGGLEVIVADTRDGKRLPPDAPFRLIVPKDKRTDRWVSQVAMIEVIDASGP